MKSANKFFNAAKANDTLVLSIYDAIGADIFGDGITAGMVQDAINQGNYSNITVRLNSPGGDAFEGVAIYNVLRSSGKPINVIVDGLAASAASIIMMAGDIRTVNAGAMVMIHEAQALTIGNAAEMTQMAATLAKVTSSIADIYVERTGIDKNEVLKLMAAETWMDADEAVANGFATSINKAKTAVKNEFDLKMFRNAPATLKVNADTDPDGDGDNDSNSDGDNDGDKCGCNCAECQGDNCAECSNADCTDKICDCSSTKNKVENAFDQLLIYKKRLELAKKR